MASLTSVTPGNSTIILESLFTFAPAARQLVSHGHVLVNEKRVNIPSYQVKSGQVITLNQKALEIPQVKKTFDATKNDKLPDWLERKAVAGKIKHLPTREDIAEDINDQLIVEYYSR
jgi:small subunit ribosomal protein S4